MISGFIQTYTGKSFRPLAARPEDVDIHDIAHALALKCRFNGHCKSFYSVAEHSVRVSRYLEQTGAPPKIALWGLMHDAGEAYLADLGGPIKRMFHVHHDTPAGPNGSQIETFADAEDRLLDVIANALHFDPIDYIAVREADLRLLMTEARDVMGGQTVSWQVKEPPLPETILPVSWQEAEQLFLARWQQLRPDPPCSEFRL
jgi:hypothetical protein